MRVIDDLSILSEYLVQPWEEEAVVGRSMACDLRPYEECSSPSGPSVLPGKGCVEQKILFKIPSLDELVRQNWSGQVYLGAALASVGMLITCLS